MQRKAVKPPQRTALESPPGAPARKYVLPTSRALIGALLIALSVVGVVGAVALSRQDTRSPYLVAVRDIGVGEVLEPTDFKVVLADVPSSVRSGLFDNAQTVSGAVTIAPIGKGNLLVGTSLMDGENARNAEVSIRISKARALNGRLQRGERVDVLATFGQGQDADTQVVARNALVANVDDAESGIATEGDLVLTLAFPPAADLRSVVNAADSGDISVVRTGVSLSAGQPALSSGAGSDIDQMRAQPETGLQSGVDPAADPGSPGAAAPEGLPTAEGALDPPAAGGPPEVPTEQAPELPADPQPEPGPVAP